MVKILHCADVHLDSALTGRSKTAELRRQDIRDSFSAAVSLAVKQGVRLFLISGDLFDNEAVSPHTLTFLKNEFLRADNIRFFICSGNHDCCGAASVYNYADFPENVYVFKKDKIESVIIPEFNVCIYGAGSTRPHNESRVLSGFHVENPELINIMLFHGNLSGAAKENYSPLTAEDIKNSGLDYIALRHIHKFSGIEKLYNTYYAYSGCIEGRGFDETGEKGALIGNIGKGICALEFYPVCRRQYMSIQCSVDGLDDITRIKEAVTECLKKVDPKNLIRVTLTGVCSAELINLKLLAADFADRFFYFELRDKTREPAHVLNMPGKRTLTGIFLSSLEDEDPEVTALAKKYAFSALSDQKEIDYED